MAADWIAVQRAHYLRRSGEISGQKTISEYSVTADGEVINDRSNARYLIEKNIRFRGLHFDLKKGRETFINKLPPRLREKSFTSLCGWACAQNGDTLKQVFDGAEFAGKQEVFNRIAAIIHMKWRPVDAWKMFAVKIDGVILLGSKARPSGSGLSLYTGCKFQQYMTTDRPDGERDTDSPVVCGPTFEMMVRSDLSSDGRTLNICSLSVIDAFCGDEPIKFRSTTEETAERFFNKLEHVLYSEMTGVKRIVTGYKNSYNEIDGFILNKVVDRRVFHMKQSLNGAENQCYAFLCDVLSHVKSMLKQETACEITFYPERGSIMITPMPMKEAKKNGLTSEFLTRFNLAD